MRYHMLLCVLSCILDLAVCLVGLVDILIKLPQACNLLLAGLKLTLEGLDLGSQNFFSDRCSVGSTLRAVRCGRIELRGRVGVLSGRHGCSIVETA